MSHYTDEDIRELVDCLNQEKTCVAALQKELETLRLHRHFEAKDSVLEEENKKSQRMLKFFKERVDELEGIEKKLYSENQGLRLLLEEEKKNSQKRETPSHSVKNLASKLETEKGIKTEQQELESRLKIIQSQLNQEKQDKEYLQNELKQKEKTHFEVRDYEVSHKKLLEKRKELEEALQEERMSYQKLQHENKQLSDQLGEVKLHSQQLEKGISYLRTKVEESKTDREGYEVDFNEMERRYKKLQTEFDELKSGHSLPNRAPSLAANNESLKEQVLQAAKFVEEKTKCQLETEKDVKQLQNENLKLKNLLDQRSSELVELGSTIESLKQTIANELQNINELESQYTGMYTHNSNNSGEEFLENRAHTERHVQTLIEKDKAINHLQEESHALKETAKSLTLLREENENLLAKVTFSERKIQEFEIAFEEVKLENQHLRENSHESEKQLELSNQAIFEKEKALTSLKETKLQLEEVIHQSKNLEIEKSELTAKVTRLETEVNDLVQEHSQFGAVRGVLDGQISHLTGQLKEREEQIEKRGAESNFHKQELQKVREQNLHLQTALQDKEQQIKTAQQHLAKKMKEIVQLNDRIREQEFAGSDTKSRLEGALSKISEIKTQFDTVEREKNLQIVKLEDNLKKWQDKAEEIHHKNQEMTQRLKELAPMKEKYLHMQNVFGKLGNMFMNQGQSIEEPSRLFDEPPVPQKTVPKSSLKEEVEGTPARKQERSEEADLFSQMSSHSKRFKESLFEDA